MAIGPCIPAFAATAVLMTGAVAHADAQDDQFLGLLSRDGITAGPPDQLIALAHERCDNDSLPRSGAFTFHFGAMPSPFSTAQLQLGGAERAWHRAEVKGKGSRARKAVVITTFMRKSDQLIWWAGGNAVPRQQAQKLVILRVSVSDST